jgi:hypothetical protein
MKPFTQIAIPHDDVVQGRLTMDVFAADLWQVAMGKYVWPNTRCPLPPLPNSAGRIK